MMEVMWFLIGTMLGILSMGFVCYIANRYLQGIIADMLDNSKDQGPEYLREIMTDMAMALRPDNSLK